MNTPSLLLARLCAAAVLVAPLSLLGSMNEETVTELKLVKFVEPVFPDGLRQEGVPEGHVTLAVGCDAGGVPTDILVLTATHPKLADAAVQAVREWRFTPSDNPAARAPRTIRVGFKLEGVIMIYPFGRNYEEQVAATVSNQLMRAPVKVPRVQMLAQAPKPLAQPMPAYPAELASQGREGTAVVHFYIDADGRVRLPAVIEASAPEFAAAALAAVAKWRYEPPRAGARAIVASDNWSFKFRAVN